MNKPKMGIKFCGMDLKNPVMVASGTFGYGPEYADLINIDRLGAVIVKGISSQPWEGNLLPRMVEVPGGLVNAIGLQNPGVEKFIAYYVPFMAKHKVPLIVNIWGRTVDEYADVAAKLNGIKTVKALEINISCPNIKDGGLSFGTDPAAAAKVITAVRSSTTLPIIPKLSPNVSNIKTFAKVAEDCGADAISLINTIPAMVIDIETRKPVLANKVGGLSGPAIHPVAVKLVWEAASVVKIPIIGMGGIMSAKEAIEFLIAGASAVAVGTANFTDPTIAMDVVKGIEEYLVRHKMQSVSQLIGSVGK